MRSERVFPQAQVLSFEYDKIIYISQVGLVRMSISKGFTAIQSEGKSRVHVVSTWNPLPSLP